MSDECSKRKEKFVFVFGGRVGMFRCIHTIGSGAENKTDDEKDDFKSRTV